ncbi:hypothetical protein C0584_04340 [Candidatus Parcubacteria bacterium]|nr:MAG: hypothetical protein C0584_04340 [Candidatus Parcubacteria bacterium]
MNFQENINSDQINYDTMLNVDMSFFVILSIILIVIFFIFKISRYFIKYFHQKNKYHGHKMFLVKLPKERPGDKDREETLQELQEDIAVAETIFASIGGLRAERGFKAWLYGREDHFSFEIVASEKLISFYVLATEGQSRYLQQQIQAHYPDASMEEVEDYNIFHPNTQTVAGVMITKKHYIFPIKTYKTMEDDPLNSILNVMSKLEMNEGMTIQFVVRSAKGVWHKKAGEVVRKAHHAGTTQEAFSGLNRGRVLNSFLELLSISKPKKKDELNQNQMDQKRLTSMEEEMLKEIETKNSKAGLEINIRVVVSASDKAKAQIYLDNISNVMSQYNHYEYGNNFNSKFIKRNQKKIVHDFIYRRFDESIARIFNTEELASMFHFPLKGAETPNIVWLTARHSAAPSDVPSEGIILGKNVFRGVNKDIHFKKEDRRRHHYIIGKSGVGKSVMLTNMAIQDIENGDGICLLDPHGDLIDDVLKRIPPERAEDVVLFAPADTERPLALNLLEYDPKYPEQKTFVINEMIKIFDKLYDLKSTGGPIFEQYIRNAMLLIMDDPSTGSTLMEIPKVLADAEFRKMKLAACRDHTVVEFWEKEAEKAGGDAALANVVPYITSKLTTFISNDTMRPIIGQQKSSFNFREIMDGQKILLVDLSKGQIGELNAYLLGLVLIGKILMASLSRTDISAEKRKDFYLYIDEFQNFTTDSISSILSEARKYGLNLIIAHQYIGQLVNKGDSTIKDAVFGNVGTWTSFKIGSEDAEVLEKEFSPTFNQYDLINIEKGTAYMKLLVDNTATRPFSMRTTWPVLGTVRDGVDQKIKTLSRFKYGRDRSIIEAEIKRRSNIN